MFIRRCSTQLQRRRHRFDYIRDHKNKYGVETFSTLIIPLMFGLFTVGSTIYLHRSAVLDRREDLERFKSETKEQRTHEWIISKSNQDTQNKAGINRYQDEVMVDYIKEIGDLLKENNGSLMSNRLTTTLARVKTLNVLRHLDGSRQKHVIRFLFEAKQITGTRDFLPVDITTAELIDIDFAKLSSAIIIENSTFNGVSLRNCTFSGIRLIDNVNFTAAFFDHVNFSNIYIMAVDFRHSGFHSADFSSNFMEDTNFSSSLIKDTTFSFAGLYVVDFSAVHLGIIHLKSILEMTSDFLILAGKQRVFQHAVIERSDFTACNCEMADFTYANLSGSQFFNANLKNTSFQSACLHDVNFSGANLWNANFTDSTITDNQLRSALSMRNAILPNGTRGPARNLIKNGDAICNILSLDSWHMQKGQVAVRASKDDPADCQFVLRSSRLGAIMWQRIRLIDFWNSTLWTNSSVELHFSKSSYVSIELNGQHKNGTVLEKTISNPTENKIMMELREGMVGLDVLVKFDAQNRNEYTWCDNIELFINYDMLPYNYSYDRWLRTDIRVSSLLRLHAPFQ